MTNTYFIYVIYLLINLIKFGNLPGNIRLSKHQTILENPGTDVGRQYAMLSHFVRQLI